MNRDKKLSATFQKSARVVSDYAPDMIFEQPRENLFLQELSGKVGFLILKN